VVSKDGLNVVPFSNYNFHNFAWPSSSERLTFYLDGIAYKRPEEYYYAKQLNHGIVEGPYGVLRDQSKWWLNGHILCNTAGPWGLRGIDDITKYLEKSLLPWTHDTFIFFVNRRDFPIFMAGSKITPLWPVFGRTPELPQFYGLPEWSGVLSYYASKENADLLWPVPEQWSLSKQQFAPWPKIPKAVFRGSLTGRFIDSRNIRLSLISLRHPDVDAGLTAWTPRCRIYGTQVVYNGKPRDFHLCDTLSPYEQSKYAVIIYVPGHAASMRLGWHYLSGSCVIKIDDSSCAAPLQWFDTLITEDHCFIENKHFLRSTLSNLPNLLLSLHTEEGLAKLQQIGQEAQKVARRVFDTDFMKSYTRNRIMSMMKVS